MAVCVCVLVKSSVLLLLKVVPPCLWQSMQPAMSVSSMRAYVPIYVCLSVSACVPLCVSLGYIISLLRPQKGKQQLHPSAWVETMGPWGTGLASSGQEGGPWARATGRGGHAPNITTHYPFY